MTENHARVGSIDMRWLEHGSGTPVVLVHGIPTSPELWRHVAPHLSGVRVLAWEMVGYGLSMDQGARAAISVAAQAGHLESWLDHLGIDRAVLVGHDLGGGVVQILAVRHPERVMGLVLTNAIGYDSWPIPSVKAMRAVGGLLRHLPPRLIAAALRLIMVRGHDSLAMAGEAAEVHLPRYARSDGARAFVRQLRALDVRDTLAVQDDLASLDVPAELVWGAADQFQGVEYGERFARDLDAPLDRIEEGKHFTPEDHPERVAAAIERVLARVAGPAD